MDADTVYKNKIGMRMTKILMDAFENGDVSKADMSYLASYILGKMEQAETSSEVFEFVLELSRDWPIFADLTAQPANQPFLDEVAEDNPQNINTQSINITEQ